MVIKKSPTGSLTVDDSPAFIEMMLVVFAVASLGVVVFEPGLRAAGVGAFVVCFALFLGQKRTQYVFDPAKRTLTVVERSLLGGRSLQMRFEDIQSIDVQVGGAVFGGVTYRAAIATTVGVFALQTRYESDKADLRRCVDVISACMGGVTVTDAAVGGRAPRRQSSDV